jgi:hypothetical protein
LLYHRAGRIPIKINRHEYHKINGSELIFVGHDVSPFPGLASTQQVLNPIESTRSKVHDGRSKEFFIALVTP